MRRLLMAVLAMLPGVAWAGQPSAPTPTPAAIGAVAIGGADDVNTVAASPLSASMAAQKPGSVAVSGGTVDGVTIGSANPAVRLNISRGNINYSGALTHYVPANQAVTAYSYFSGAGGGSDANGGTDQHAAAYDMNVTSDTLNYGGNNYVDAMHIEHNFGGSIATKGSRAGLSIRLTQTGVTGNTTNQGYYVALDAVATCNYNEGGTSGGIANVSGQCVAFNPIAGLGSGATYYYTLNTAEFDTLAPTGSSVAHKFGYLGILSGGDAVRGTYDDAAMAYALGSTSSPGWKYLIANGKTDGTPATAADSTVLGCVQNVGTATPCPALYGIDFNNWNWGSAGVPFRSPGFIVDRAGNTTTNALVTTGSVTANTIQPLGSVTQILPAVTYFGGSYAASSPPVITISAPASGVTATASVASYTYTGSAIVSGGTGYVVGDILTGPNGTQVRVSSVSTGAITGTSFYGTNPVVNSIPSSPYAYTGGTGSGATFTPLYSPNSVTVINAGGPYTTAPTVTFSPDYYSTRSNSVALISNQIVLAGGGGVVVPGPLAVSAAEAHATATKTASFAFDATMHNVAASATSAAIVGTLPACVAATRGRVYALKKLDASTNAVSFAAAGSDLIDGAATLALTTQYTAASVQCSDTAGRWDRGLN